MGKESKIPSIVEPCVTVAALARVTNLVTVTLDAGPGTVRAPVRNQKFLSIFRRRWREVKENLENQRSTDSNISTSIHVASLSIATSNYMVYTWVGGQKCQIGKQRRTGINTHMAIR